MSRQGTWSHRKLALLTMACWFAATGVLFCLAGSLAPSPTQEGFEDDHGSLVARLFGSSRTIISHHLLLEADRYFHKGIRVRSKRAFSNALFLRWADQIAPTRHEEVRGNALSEIMPWLQMSIGSDPQNYDAWVAAGYWLLQQGNMTAAVDLMREGQQQNPADYRFFSGLGQLYFFNLDYAAALVEFSLARELWPRYSRESEDDHRRGLGEILTFRAGINQALGNRHAALEEYRELQQLFPARTHLADRIAELEAGDGQVVDAELQLLGHHEEIQQHVLQFRSSDAHVHHSGCAHN